MLISLPSDNGSCCAGPAPSSPYLPHITICCILNREGGTADAAATQCLCARSIQSPESILFLSAMLKPLSLLFHGRSGWVLLQPWAPHPPSMEGRAGCVAAHHRAHLHAFSPSQCPPSAPISSQLSTMRLLIALSLSSLLPRLSNAAETSERFHVVGLCSHRLP